MERSFTECGGCTAHVLRPDGPAGPACEFAVRDLDLSLPEGSVSLAEEWRVTFRSENVPIAAVYLFHEGDSSDCIPSF